MDVLRSYLDQREQEATEAAQQAKRDGTTPAGTPDAMVQELLGEIGRRFYAKDDGERWLKHQPALMLALTWPAGWLKQRGVTLPLDRYRTTMMEIIEGIAEHGDVSKVGYFPAYFLHCVRLWFVHNGEEVYERQKHVRNAIDRKMLQGGAAQAGTAPDPIEALAAAHRVLAGRKRPAKAPKAADSQTTLFDV